MGLCLDPLRLLWWGVWERWLPENRQFSGLSVLNFYGSGRKNLQRWDEITPNPSRGVKLPCGCPG